MNKESITLGVAGLIIGLLLGLLIGGKMLGGSGAATTTPAQTAAPMVSQADLNVRIAEIENVVAKDPKNVQAWVTLGNDYFDAHNPQKAVQAYARALELNPNDPNVLTDQGVMFRALGFFDKALANFEKANKLNPQHLQSLYNSGIVYAVDMKQPAKARPILERVAQQGGSSELGNQAREMLQQLPK
ncbi:MAG: tetratricopeptide repeat protein [Trichlorobacter sp.]|jgi:Tfp pilus assembly protein PilF